MRRQHEPTHEIIRAAENYNCNGAAEQQLHHVSTFHLKNVAIGGVALRLVHECPRKLSIYEKRVQTAKFVRTT